MIFRNWFDVSGIGDRNFNSRYQSGRLWKNMLYHVECIQWAKVDKYEFLQILLLREYKYLYFALHV